MKTFIKEHFPNTPLFNFALEVEKITTAKVAHNFLVHSTFSVSEVSYIIVFFEDDLVLLFELGMNSHLPAVAIKVRDLLFCHCPLFVPGRNTT